MQNIFITGTSKGLGYGLTRYYLESGARVYGISRESNPTLKGYPQYNFLSQDLSQFKSLKKNIPVFLSGVSRIDLVILNAGILNELKDIRDTSIDEIRKVMDVNVWANKILIDLLFEQVDEINQVVAISSGAAVSGARGWNAYSLSKACLNMLVSLYAKELTDCHFIALAPGLIKTNMQDYVNDLSDETALKFPVVRKLKDARGTEKMPLPEDAAKIVAASINRAKQYDSGSFLDVREMQH
jgi:NAD(P)-dependent dehydrogenase (short-subunit alcohol dehydrogenase family)